MLEILYDYRGEIVREQFTEKETGSDVSKFCEEFDLQNSLDSIGKKFDLWYPQKITAVFKEERIIKEFEPPVAKVFEVPRENFE